MILDILKNKWKSRLKTLFKNREKLSRTDFIRKMNFKGYNSSIVEITYDKISNFLPSSLDKNIYPEDDLLNDYYIDDEDLGDVMIEIFKECKIKFPEVEKQREFYIKNGEEITVEKMIHFVDYFGSQSI